MSAVVLAFGKPTVCVECGATYRKAPETNPHVKLADICPACRTGMERKDPKPIDRNQALADAARRWHVRTVKQQTVRYFGPAETPDE